MASVSALKFEALIKKRKTENGVTEWAPLIEEKL